MYSELHVEYSDPTQKLHPIVLRYKLNKFSVTQKWANRLAYAIENNHKIDDPGRFYGFEDITIERKKAVTAINKCCEIIDQYSPNFVGRRVDENDIDQDTLNYLHNIFEQYHGTLNTPHEFFLKAPDDVKKALAQLNLEVHRCESLATGSVRRMMPTHMVTYYSLERNEQFTLDVEDYEHFTDLYEFGTVYLLYTEIGKTLQDLAIDNDDHVHEDAYKPFRHYSADFVIRMYTTSHQFWINSRKLYKKHFDEKKDYYLSKGYNYSHPYNRPGNIPLGKLMNTVLDIKTEIAKRQWVSSVKLI